MCRGPLITAAMMPAAGAPGKIHERVRVHPVGKGGASACGTPVVAFCKRPRVQLRWRACRVPRGRSITRRGQSTGSLDSHRAAVPTLWREIMGSWLSERLGQQIIIENKPGAATNIATQAVINSPP
jgi:hypothetical protein